MKSVGEVMAMGRTFKESLQKALRGLETGLSGLDEIEVPGLAGDDRPQEAMLAALARPTPDRLRLIAQAFREGLGLAEIQGACAYDPWFLAQIQDIVRTEAALRRDGLPEDAASLHALKADGFSDKRLADLTGLGEDDVRARRWALRVRPVFKRIDTCAAEFAARTPYLYSCYETGILGDPFGECESRPSDRRKVIILGGGPNRIGQGIEFDYCCVHASFGLREAGLETVMINCNPETVSTDPDTSDRLYFEPLTAEDVLEICRLEASNGELLGVIVQLGGQTPLKLCHALEKAGVPILGTSPDAIDLAEDRERFQQLLHRLGLKQPDNDICVGVTDAIEKAEALGFPLVIRPSYVLGGRSMRIVHSVDEVRSFMTDAARVSDIGPILIDRYLQDAVEVDVDVVADRETVRIAGVMEHVEEAGIHSGDSACSLPPYSLPPAIVAEIARQAEALARALGRVRPDERADGGQGRRGVHPRGQSARQPHRTVRRQGDRQPPSQDRGARDGRRTPGRLHHSAAAGGAGGGQGGCVPVRPLPGCGPAPGPGDEVDRRGDGPGSRLRRGFRQVAARSGYRAARHGHGVRLGARPRQGCRGRACPEPARVGVRCCRHAWHGGGAGGRPGSPSRQ